MSNTKRKELGSQVFNTNIVKTDEYLLMAKSMTKGGLKTGEAVLFIEAIDQMLCLQRTQIFSKAVRYTSTGAVRKNSFLINNYSNVIDDLSNNLNELKETT